MSKHRERSKLRKRLRERFRKHLELNGSFTPTEGIETLHSIEKSNKNIHHKEWWEMEFVIKIFEFLDIASNITSISLVCNQWHTFSFNHSLWTSFRIDSKMITNIHTFSISLIRWKRIKTLSIHIGLDIDPFHAFEVLERLEFQCKCTEIINLSLHVFGFDGAQIIDRLLYCIKRLMVRNSHCIKRLSMEFGHGLTVSCLPNPTTIAFEHITHLILERIGFCRLNSVNLWSSLFPNITHLSINYAGLTESVFVDFSHCQHIEFLSIFMLEHEWMTIPRTIEMLSLFPRIIGLQLEYPRFEANEHFFEEIAVKLPKIEVLYFWWWSLLEAHYDIILRSFSKLKKLGFAYSSISTQFIEEHPLTESKEQIGLYGNLWNMNTVNILQIDDDNDVNAERGSAVPNVYIQNADDIASLFC